MKPPMNNRHFFVFDFETGGLDARVHDPVQIAVQVLDSQSLKPLASFISYIKPDPSRVTEAALQVNNLSLEALREAPDPRDVVSSLVEFLQPFGRGLFVAHNAKFDYDFLSTLLERHGSGVAVGQLVDHRILCTIQMTFQRFVLAEQRFTKLTLSQLSEHFKIPHNPHEAFSDVLVAAELLRLCLRQPFWFRLIRGIRLAFRDRDIQKVAVSLRQVF